MELNETVVKCDILVWIIGAWWTNSVDIEMAVYVRDNIGTRPVTMIYIL